MRIPVRIISAATTFLWIFLILFFVSAVYSVKDVRFDVGDPEIGLTSEDKTVFSLPITIDNQGYYNIDSFNTTTKILGEENSIIARASTYIPVIEKGEEVKVTHNMTVDIDDLLHECQDYLFNDTSLEVDTTVGLELGGVIPVRVSTNISVPWGAPLYNFTLKEIQYTTLNGTHMTATVPVCFENHAVFNLTGNLQIHLYNSTDAMLGEGEAIIRAPKNAGYQDRVMFIIPMAGITGKGYYTVYFSTQFFDSEPVVFHYG